MTKPVVAAILAGLLLGFSTANAADTTQLAASAGLTKSEAAGMSLEQIARAKFSADSRGDDAIAVFIRPGASSAAARSQLTAAVGIDADQARRMSLTDIVVAKINRSTPQNDAVIVVSARNVGPKASSGRSQLAAAAGLDMTAATLQQLHVAKINAERRPDERVAVR